MNRLSAAVSDFRPERKCFSISGSLLLMLLLLVSQAACRPPDETDSNANDEYTDVDNVEWHDVKVVDGIMHEDHPVIMYKEDFVSEDFVPNNNSSSEANSESTPATRPTRKYKDIAHRRHRLNRPETEKYHAMKPEKIYFDVLPQAPVVVSDDSAANDSKFDPSKIHADFVDTIDEDQQAEAPSKQLLNKRPKKYRSRSRRDVHQEHIVRKRTPHISYDAAYGANGVVGIPYRHSLGESYPRYHKHSTQGKYWNGLDAKVNTSGVDEEAQFIENRFGNADETDRVIWGRAPRTRRPTVQAQSPPSRGVDLMTIFTTPRTISRPVTTSRPPPPAVETSATGVSQCVWAIVSCCSVRDNQIRYNCFEQLGCRGAFWDLNPCADNVRDAVVEFASDIYD